MKGAPFSKNEYLACFQVSEQILLKERIKGASFDTWPNKRISYIGANA